MGNLRFCVLVSAALLGACSATGPVGGAVAGASDSHCAQPDGGVKAQATAQASCHLSGGAAADYGETNFNATAFDDDCKYLITWAATPIRQHEDVTVTATVTNTVGGAATTGASLSTEIFLSSTHPAPNSGVKTVEAPNGTYTIGPIRFDAAGRWTLRFHAFEECTDAAEETPHAHGAFFVDVP
jgi:hypothetical protein